MNSRFVVACFCAFVLSMVSCEKSVDIDFQTNDRRLVVNGEFTSDTTIHSISLYCSGSVTTGRPQTVVSGAKAFITDGIDTVMYLENPNSPGHYQTPTACFGIGGHTYTLDISNVDVDGNGTLEEYTAQTMMPVPIEFDSLVSHLGENGDQIKGTIENIAYYKTMYNGPDYLFDYLILNSDTLWTLTDELGSGSFRAMFRAPKVNNPGLTLSGSSNLYIEPKMSGVSTGDIISFVCLNFTAAQYEFLKAFNNNTTSGDLIEDNLYDQLRIPANLPTNIQPSDKAAGYFFIYSVSRITGVFEASQ